MFTARSGEHDTVQGMTQFKGNRPVQTCCTKVIQDWAADLQQSLRLLQGCRAGQSGFKAVYNLDTTLRHLRSVHTEAANSLLPAVSPGLPRLRAARQAGLAWQCVCCSAQQVGLGAF